MEEFFSQITNLFGRVLLHHCLFWMCVDFFEIFKSVILEEGMVTSKEIPVLPPCLALEIIDIGRIVQHDIINVSLSCSIILEKWRAIIVSLT